MITFRTARFLTSRTDVVTTVFPPPSTWIWDCNISNIFTDTLSAPETFNTVFVLGAGRVQLILLVYLNKIYLECNFATEDSRRFNYFHNMFETCLRKEIDY